MDTCCKWQTNSLHSSNLSQLGSVFSALAIAPHGASTKPASHSNRPHRRQQDSVLALHRTSQSKHCTVLAPYTRKVFCSHLVVSGSGCKGTGWEWVVVGGSGCRGSLRDRMANDILPERFVYDTSQLEFTPFSSCDLLAPYPYRTRTAPHKPAKC